MTLAVDQSIPLAASLVAIATAIWRAGSVRVDLERRLGAFATHDELATTAHADSLAEVLAEIREIRDELHRVELRVERIDTQLADIYRTPTGSFRIRQQE